MTAFEDLMSAIDRLPDDARILVGAYREELRADRPSRFTATPAEIDAFLAKYFAEDVRLRYQQAIGAAAVIEAAEDVRGDSGHIRYGAGVDYAERHATLIDPRKHGGPYPSALINLNANKEA